MLRPIAENLWSHDTSLRMPGGVHLPSRATVVRTSTGELLLHSPLALDDATAAELDRLGEVRWIVAPSAVHWLFVKAAKERYPNAKVLGAPLLQRKLPDFPMDPLPARGAVDPALGDELEVLRIDGAPFMDEHVFFHRPSRTALVTDLLFNVRQSESFVTRFFLRLVGTLGKTAQSRIWRLLVRDRGAAAESASHLLRWDFRRLVMAHGDLLDDSAHARTTVALGWMTRAAPKLLAAPQA